MWWFLLETSLAATLRVPTDHPTVEAAVLASQPNDIIEIEAGPLPFVETVTITHSLTFQGTGGRPVLQGTHPDRGFFYINSATAVVTIEGVEIDGRGDFPALRLQQGTVRLLSSEVHDCESLQAGGAIHVAGGNNRLEIADSVLRDSYSSGATQSGGIIASMGGEVLIQRSALLRGTTARYGGLVWYTGTGTVTIEDSLLQEGQAGHRGGAAAVVGRLRALRSRFVGNRVTADRGGGALYIEGTYDHEVHDDWFIANGAPTSMEGGGALILWNGTLGVKRSVFCDNEADEGGAIRVHVGNATVSASVFLNNRAVTSGGDVFNNASTILDHISTSGAQAPSGASQRSRADTLVIRDSYLADSGPGLAIDSFSSNDTHISWILLWNNAGGNWNSPNTVDNGNNLLTVDPLLQPVVGCDPLALRPGPGSPLLEAGQGGTDIGAFSGPDTWPDLDGDGWPSLADCDDDDSAVQAPQPEIPGNGVDDDCDGFELCWLDADLDEHGEPVAMPSTDLDCTDPHEAAQPNDLCPAGDDRVDTDTDSVPDACDPCPLSATGDSDGDGTCDDADLCPDHPEWDTDTDGVPDGCDACPLDPLDDLDHDGVCDTDDRCPGYDDTFDTDGDGIPNACEQACSLPDSDGDGVPDDCDLCPAGDDGFDYDSDLLPDACDPCPLDSPDDSDEDGICDSDDLCEGEDDTLDQDEDGLPDACDDCPEDALNDVDGDGQCGDLDPCDQDPLDDSDGDGVCDSDDRCPGADDTLDFDGDSVPDACDPCEGTGVDLDGDGLCDDPDCPGDDGTDSDGDGLPDACDPCPAGPCEGDRFPSRPGGQPALVGCGCASTRPSVGAVGLLLGAALLRRRDKR